MIGYVIIAYMAYGQLRFEYVSFNLCALLILLHLQSAVEDERLLSGWVVEEGIPGCTVDSGLSETLRDQLKVTAWSCNGVLLANKCLSIQQ